MGKVKLKIDRVMQLYQEYCKLQLKILPGLRTKGMQSAIKRQSVFLKDKITHALKELKQEVHPEVIFKTRVSDYHSTYEILVICEDTEEVKLYINALEALENRPLKIHSIEQVETTKIVQPNG